MSEVPPTLRKSPLFVGRSLERFNHPVAEVDALGYVDPQGGFFSFHIYEVRGGGLLEHGWP